MLANSGLSGHRCFSFVKNFVTSKHCYGSVVFSRSKLRRKRLNLIEEK